MAKIEIITNCVRRHVSEIKLKRTDTTLDLSQKAKLESRLVLILISLGVVGSGTYRAKEEKD